MCEVTHHIVERTAHDVADAVLVEHIAVASINVAIALDSCSVSAHRAERDEFLCFLAAQPCDLHLKYSHASQQPADFRLKPSLVIGCEPSSEQLQCGYLPRILRDDAERAKRDDAAVEGGVAFGMHLVPFHHAETCAGVLAYQVHLVPLCGAMEIQLAVGIHVAKRHAIRFSAMAAERQHAGGSVLQYRLGLRFRQGLPPSSHGSFVHLFCPFLLVLCVLCIPFAPACLLLGFHAKPES